MFRYWTDSQRVVYKNSELILGLCREGYNVRSIYKKLSTDGKISNVPERTFYRLVAILKKQGFSAPEVSAPVQVNSGARALPSSVPQPVSQGRPLGSASHTRPQTHNNIPKSQRTFRMSHHSEDVI